MPKLPAFPLRYKLPAIIVGFSLSVAIILQVYVYLSQRQQVLDWAEGQFRDLTVNRHRELGRLARSERVTNLKVLAANPTTRDAIRTDGHVVLGYSSRPDVHAAGGLHHQQPPSSARAHLMVSHDGPLSYFRQHAVYHPAFPSLRKLLEFDDIFLLDLDGNLIYSVRKNADFATNVNEGALARLGVGSGLSRCDRTGRPIRVYATDLSPYAPAGDELSGFMAEQVIGLNGQVIGVVAIKLPGERLTSIVLGNDDLGETGDVYLVGT